MIERMADMPAGTIGFRVSGDVTADDYRNGLDARSDAGRRVG
jgi:hypothetical protein